jgi:hypothetical protein
MTGRGKGVTQILVGFARHEFRRSGRIQRRLAWSLEVLMGLAIWVFASLASAQATPGPSRIQERKEKPATPVVVSPAQQPPHPVVPVYGAAAPEQTLPQPPEIAWDGKQLTIDAENSRLSDILQAIRAKTGASVDFPQGATSERVAVHLGPAPVREVLSSLLYGTDFDYVIQSTDDDEDGLRSVVVTLRGGKSDDLVGADAEQVAADAAKTPGMRLMRGYAAPGKPAFQAEAEAALAAKKAEAESGFTSESAAATDSDVPTREQGSAATSAESAATGPSPINTDPNSAPAATSSADGSTVAVSDIPPPNTAATSGDSSGEQSEATQKVQNMLNMFEQRRQIQAQQNQRATPPATN